MDDHAAQDKRYHALIAEKYDYITNEPRKYPNDLLFRPIDRRLRRARTLLDLGCGTGQMFIRYANLADKIIAVDHSKEMLQVARRNASAQGISSITFCEQDVYAFMKLNKDVKFDLITCVGVIHHLKPEEIETFLRSLKALMAPKGQCVIAEPIYSSSVPQIVADRNSKSVLHERLKETMPAHAVDPDEEPLLEQVLLETIEKVGLKISYLSKGFELFHVTEPISLWEKLIIRGIYWKHRKKGDVVALLME